MRGRWDRFAVRVSIQDLQASKDRGERFPVLTAYDYPTAKIIDELNALEASEIAPEVGRGDRPPR